MIKEIFGNPIYIANMNKDIHEQYKYIFMEKREQSLYKSWNLCSVKSTFFEEDEFIHGINNQEYRYAFEKEINNHLKNINDTLDYAIENVWYNIYTKNDFQEPHNHVGTYNNTSALSCIYCLKKSDARLYFMNPQYVQQKLCGVHTIFQKKNNYTEYYYPDVEEGTIIIFPSYLYHGVSPQKSEDERITIVCNISVIT